jgi:hypothetical protein
MVYANNCQKSYRIENNTPFTITNIRLFEHNLNQDIPPYSYIKGYTDFESDQESVLMFFVDSLNYGVYIKNSGVDRPFLIRIDSINSEARTVLISQ